MDHYDFKLDVAKRVLLEEKCVCNIEEKKKHDRKLYLSLYNGEWLKVVWILMFLLGVCST
jgi:gamma-glutamylcysteine synthetase